MVLPPISKNQKLILLLVFLFCFFIQIIPVIRSGLNYSYGIGFWGPNGHDAIWHLSLIEHIQNPLKIPMPTFSGELLKNYHPFFDILISFLSKITFIDASTWLLQIFPLISSFLFLLLSFKLGFHLSKKFSGGIILILLNALANSLGWVVTLIRSGSFYGESIFWAMQSPSNQLNPPYMLSILLLLTLIYLLQKDKANKIAIALILIFLPVIKVYSAIPAFIIFFFYVLKHKQYFSLFILSALLASLLFFQYNRTSSSLVEFKPFWFINSMIESPDKFYFPKLASLRNTLESLPDYDLRLPLIYLFGLAVFILGNFSWRLLAFKELFARRDIFISVLVCTLIPLLFIQKGTNWNTIQFLYYALFLANIPLAIYLSKHRSLSYLVIFLNLLPLIGSLPNFTGKFPPTAISPSEIAALDFLKSQKKGNVLTYPYDKYLRNSIAIKPLPIYAYETNSYVSAYSQQIVFMADEMNLENSGYNWQQRRQDSLDFFAQKNIFTDRGFLVNNQIDYLYLPKLSLPPEFKLSDQMYTQKIFENSEIIIYRVER